MRAISCLGLALSALLMAAPARAQTTGAYTTPGAFMNLFFDFTGSNETDYPAGQPTLGQMLTQSVAAYCLSRGYSIRCNDILPGYIDTAGLEKSMTQLGGMERIAALHPLGRLGRPEEVAALVAFLLSDEASYITGVHYPIDGGYLAQ